MHLPRHSPSLCLSLSLSCFPSRSYFPHWFVYGSSVMHCNCNWNACYPRLSLSISPSLSVSLRAHSLCSVYGLTAWLTPSCSALRRTWMWITNYECQVSEALRTHAICRRRRCRRCCCHRRSLLTFRRSLRSLWLRCASLLYQRLLLVSALLANVAPAVIPATHIEGIKTLCRPKEAWQTPHIYLYFNQHQ